MFRRKGATFVILVVALMIIAPPVHTQQAKQAEHKAMVPKAGMDPGRLARIPARMKEFVDKGAIAGAVTLVARHGVVASLEAVGYQDLESKRPLRTNTIFNIASMTKSVTAVGIMILLEEGRLLLSDPAEKYVPEFRGQMMIESRDGEKVLTTKRPSRPITIYDLMTHTSGMPPTYLSSDRLDYPWLRDKTLAEAVTIYSQKPLEFEPGTKVLWSNTGFHTLGRIVEVVSGQAYQDFLEQRIFRPLGMKDSFIFPLPEKYDRIASVYELENGKLKRNSDEDTYRKGWKYASPSGGIYSTASDMFAFYQMMLNGGTYRGVRILSRASVEVVTALHTGELQGNPPGSGFGLGWFVVREWYGTRTLQSIGAYGHGGGGPYQGQHRGWVDPKKDLVAVFLSNTFNLEPSSRAIPLNTFVAMAAAAIAE